MLSFFVECGTLNHKKLRNWNKRGSDMAKTLVLAEKPSVGRELARVLGCKKSGNGYLEGEKYIVTWALGHLVTLADPDVYDKSMKSGTCRTFPCCPKI